MYSDIERLPSKALSFLGSTGSVADEDDVYRPRRGNLPITHFSILEEIKGARLCTIATIR